MLPCADSFYGFEFQFTGNVDITGATVDSSTPLDFQPVKLEFGQAGATFGSPTDLFVDDEGLNPAVGSTLAIDLTFASTGGTSVPEPASLALLEAGLAGMYVAGARARRRRGRAVASA